MIVVSLLYPGSASASAYTGHIGEGQKCQNMLQPNTVACHISRAGLYVGLPHPFPRSYK